MKKLTNYLKSILFPDLFDEQVKKKNGPSQTEKKAARIRTGHTVTKGGKVLKRAGETSYDIPEEHQAMIAKALMKVGLTDDLSDKKENGALGLGINVSGISIDDKSFLDSLNEHLASCKTQEDFDKLFARVKRIMDDSGGVIADSDENSISDIVEDKLKQKLDDEFENVPEVGDPDAAGEEIKLFFKERFIDATLEFFKGDNVLSRQSLGAPKDGPFTDASSIPESLNVDAETSDTIINTVLQVYVETGNILECSAAVYKLGLNYQETHFSGLFIGILRGMNSQIQAPLALPDNSLNDYFGKVGLKKLKRIGIAYGIRQHFEGFSTDDFKLEMDKLLNI